MRNLVGTFTLPFLLCSCVYSGDNRGILDAIEPFECSEGGHIVYEGWGMTGLSKTCKSSDGVWIGGFMTAEWGRLVMTGHYTRGVEVGLWQWYDEEGKVEKTVYYP